MAQQTLIGEDYGLLAGAGDRAQNASGEGWEAAVTARPNFFANLLHRTLIAGGGGGGGGQVLVHARTCLFYT